MEWDIDRVTREIGQNIQAAREAKGTSIEDISESTRINPAYLEKIEKGEFDFLPRPYVVAYLKTFASRVGLNGEALVHEWREAELRAEQEFSEDGETETPESTEEDITPHPPKARQLQHRKEPDMAARYFKEIFMGVGIVAVLLILFVLSVNSKRSRSRTPAQQIPAQKAPQEEAEVAEVPFEQVMTEHEKRLKEAQIRMPETSTPEAPVEENIRLEVTALEEVWLQVIIDGLDEDEFTFKKGDSFQWEGSEFLEVKIGNAAGVVLRLNGKDLGPIGKQGQVATLRLTPKGVEFIRLYTPRPAPVDTSAQDDGAGGQNDLEQMRSP